jgi:eukaryotic-like serine/threonine-protein kinase
MDRSAPAKLTELGRYRIERRLGEGAMADVYRAHDPGIGRPVAVKVLKRELRQDPALAARFVQEARAAGKLQHPHIATIYDVGEADDVPYIAMELVDGCPLDRWLEREGRMPPEQVMRLGAQLADALGYAHARGIVHRDVKPSNILVSADGRTAKLLDFGVARVMDAAAHERLAQTNAGTLIGTPRYMSPEQALGRPVDARSDLFSLGAVLYEMVTGRTAFGGAGLATLALQIAQERVEPIERSVADCPPGLAFVIDKLLAKKPDARFADGAQAQAALAREVAALAAEPDARPRRGLSFRVKLPLALALVTGAALALSMTAVLARQNATLERMAVSAGDGLTAFVAANAAVQAADNAGLPAGEQDWAPLQAFVDAAARDPAVRRIVVADAHGTVRAASEAALVGRRYAAPAGEPSVADGVSAAAGAFRFVRPIRYAGADFGRVELVRSRDALDAAMAEVRALVVALALAVVLAVVLAGWWAGAAVARPLGRLCRALDEAAESGFALRLSHRRGDEFGRAFDAFNRAAAALEPRLAVPVPVPPARTPAPLDETCVAAPVPAPRKAA